MKHLLVALAAMGVVTVSRAQDPTGGKRPADRPAPAAHSQEAPKELTDAKEILRRADEALKRVNLVSYRGEFKGTGWMEDRTPTVSGTVAMRGKGTKGPEVIRLDVDIRTVAREQYRNLTVGWTGQAYYLIDPSVKTAYVGSTRSAFGPRGVNAMALALPHFSHPNALLDEMGVDLITLIGSAKVGGVDCYEIQLQNTADVGETVWWFSKKDFLPRRRQIVFTNEKLIEASLDWTCTELTVDPKFGKAPFELVIPDGYTKSDRPAP